MPKHLLRGHLRLSTVLIALVFIATLTIYLLVRPIPASGTDPPTPSTPTGQASKTAPQTRPQTPTPAVASRTPTVAPGSSHTPTTSPSPPGAQISMSPAPSR